MAQPVLILGTQARIAVTIARSLHRHAAPVDMAAYSPQDRGVSSRAIRKVVRLPSPRHRADEFALTLAELIQAEKYDMLIPCSDSALNAIGEHYEHLSAMVHVGCPPPHIVRRVLDKSITLKMAKSCGIPVPVTYLVSDADELKSVRDTLRFPMIAKPRNKMDLETHRFKIRYFQNFQELSDAFAADADFGRRTLLQEYCSGEGVGIAVLMQKGHPVATFQHRRLKELPSAGGVSVMAISEEFDSSLAKQALTLLRALEWDGVAMVEFRRDRSTRQAVLMEVNGRYWGTLSLAVHAGFDFPLYEWQVVHGESPTVPAGYIAGMRWRWATGDLVRLHDVIVDQSNNGIAVPSRLKETVRFFLDYRPSTSPALWSRRDPIPALSEFRRTVRGLLFSDAKRILRRLIPASFLKHIRTARSLDPGVRSVYLRHQILRALRIWRDNPRRIPPSVRSVIFVCHGNIIRSPMAAALLRQGLSNPELHGILVTSAGLQDNRAMNADPRALIVAREFGISLDNHRSQVVTQEMVRGADAIFVMDYINEAILLARFPYAGQKVFLLGAITEGLPARSAEIADPRRGQVADIRRCYDVLHSHILILRRLLFPPKQDDGKAV